MSHVIGFVLKRTLTRILTLLGLKWCRLTHPSARMERRITKPSAPQLRTGARRPDPFGPPTIDPPTPLVRPYLLAHEQQARRRALALALDGIDIGPWVIHGHTIGMPAAGVAA
ncbi:hypothetical protein [Streptomyces sp. NPDC003077]|uniref:hypothetical protein n=1 Tax=Streptomyces sp. NPDC003077 TaxID=3154443 RepID=UPI0033A35743